MARVVVAVDSFKGSLAAADAAATIAAAWRAVRPGDTVVLRPMADGGEGTCAAFEAAVHGARRMPVTVTGPAGSDIAAHWLLLPDGTGVVELASTSGIELLREARRPFDADTTGFGQAIAAAMAHGVERLVLGIGSSASTDCGVGLLRALGARLLDCDGSAIAPGLRGLASIAAVDLSRLVPPPADGALVLSDVSNPLLGANGAAAVFGPQKGLRPDDVDFADRCLAHAASFLPAGPETPGAGAAGGTGFALLAWGARLMPGAAEVARIVGLADAIRDADLVITGEGRYDAQSASGKVPGFVAALARDARVPVALVAGSIDADTHEFVLSRSLTESAGSAQEALREPRRWLADAAALLAARLDR